MSTLSTLVMKRIHRRRELKHSSQVYVLYINGNVIKLGCDDGTFTTTNTVKFTELKKKGLMGDICHH